MSRGRHRGASHWGILPPTGQSLETLPRDISVIIVRCFLFSWCVLTLAIFLIIAYERSVGMDLALAVAFSISITLGVVGVALTRYHRVTLGYSKAQQGDMWLHQVRVHRVQWLVRREVYLLDSIDDLRSHFEMEKKALEEVREERIAEERMLGFVDGLQKSSSVMAYMANPRNRLRVVSEDSEKSA